MSASVTPLAPARPLPSPPRPPQPLQSRARTLLPALRLVALATTDQSKNGARIRLWPDQCHAAPSKRHRAGNTSGACCLPSCGRPFAREDLFPRRQRIRAQLLQPFRLACLVSLKGKRLNLQGLGALEDLMSLLGGDLSRASATIETRRALPKSPVFWRKHEKTCNVPFSQSDPRPRHSIT
jgi:hypothetical protein